METWYILEDGSAADPRDVVRHQGRLRHKDGRAVAYRPDGETPCSRGVDVDAERGKAVATGEMTANQARNRAGLSVAGRRESIAPEDRELRAKSHGKGRGKGYRTR